MLQYMASGFLEPILHVDMDAFFVEVERLDDSDLVGRPVAVGGVGPRGVVASASYEARDFGVRSAMPTARALRLCPRLVMVPSRHGRYGEMSARVFEIFRSYTPLVEGLSLDEAFLDVGGLRRHYDEPAGVADAVRASISESLGLPSSVGVAATKFIAKVASAKAKPNGMLVVPAGTESAFLQPLDVGALWGVGEVTRAALEQFGVRTVGDLAAVPLNTLERRLGTASARHLHDLSLGLDPRAVEPDTAAKSVSAEQTFAHDLIDMDAIEAEVLRQCDRVAVRLRRSGLAGSTVALKVRFDDFTTLTRQVALSDPSDVARDIYGAARRLLGAVDIGDRPVRLLGVGVSSLSEHGGPRQLATDRSAEWDELADAVDAVRVRFGDDSVSPARLAKRGESESTRFNNRSTTL